MGEYERGNAETVWKSHQIDKISQSNWIKVKSLIKS